jgi:hypothetical protein
VTAPAEPDGWDAALADLLASEAGGTGGAGKAGDGLPPAPPAPELDLSGPPAEPKPREVAVLVVRARDATLLAAVLKGPRVDALALVKDGLGMAVLDDPTEAAALAAASRLSDTVGQETVLLLHRGPSDNPGAADLQAYQYQAGQEVASLAAGLVLAQLPQVLEDLLIDPEEGDKALRYAVHTGDLTTQQAIAIIAGVRHRRPRRPRGE